MGCVCARRDVESPFTSEMYTHSQAAAAPLQKASVNSSQCQSRLSISLLASDHSCVSKLLRTRETILAHSNQRDENGPQCGKGRGVSSKDSSVTRPITLDLRKDREYSGMI